MMADTRRYNPYHGLSLANELRAANKQIASFKEQEKELYLTIYELGEQIRADRKFVLGLQKKLDALRAERA